jgi:ribosomal-protein-alanine N-acetyltransferase
MRRPSRARYGRIAAPDTIGSMGPVLDTPRLRLRPFCPADAESVVRLAGHREIAATTLTIPHPYSQQDAQTWIGAHAAEAEAGRAWTFAITLRSGELVGAIGLHVVPAHRRAEVGYWIGVDRWGQGFASEALRAMLDFGFSTLGLNRIEAHVFPGNPASRRVLEKLGFRFEGLLRQHVVKDGVPLDGLFYARLSSDGE